MSEPTPPQSWSAARDLGAIIVRARNADIAGAVTAAAPIEGAACYRTGPFEWIAICAPADAGRMLAALRAACGDGAVLAIDISDGVVAFELTGARGAERLSAYCDLDLDGGRLTAGAATRTRLGDIGVVLARPDDRPAWLLIADRSHADYLALLMRHGAPAR